MSCAGCGTDNPTWARFCGACGDALAERRTAGLISRTRSPLDYTPGHLIEKILTSRSALEGERKQVTVLFVDLLGSLGLAENVDVEDLHKIMDRFFAILSEGIHRFEGTINQFTGDGIMSLFGAPPVPG